MIDMTDVVMWTIMMGTIVLTMMSIEEEVDETCNGNAIVVNAQGVLVLSMKFFTHRRNHGCTN